MKSLATAGVEDLDNLARRVYRSAGMNRIDSETTDKLLKKISSLRDDIVATAEVKKPIDIGTHRG